ncbi:hypothetical protein QQ045_004679 [Rhodiola kirilowii]
MNENDQVGGSGSGESQNNQTLPRTKLNKSRKRDSSPRDQQGDEIWYREVNDKEDGEENQEDDEVWNSFNDGFRQVQSLLDRNRILIQQVNENHRSKIAENMVKNVALIQEMNANISNIVCIYSDLSNDFSTVFHHRAAAAVENGNCVD